MSNFIYDIQLGFLAFPLVALLLAMPYALYQYRRFGAISIWKTFVVFTFILYCLCAVSLIVFPLPKDPNHIVAIAQTPQLQPFHFVEQIQETTDFSWSDRSTWGPTLKARAAYEAYFNVLLTVPLGAYLCYLFRCRWWMALLIGIATTLLFETSQLTGLFGIYEHPYRLFDVDDLILNTTGAMLGFWLMIPFAWALPSMDEVNEQSRERGSSRVSLTRRLIAALVDLTILFALFAIAWIMLSPTDAQIAKALAVDPSRAGAKTLAFRFIGGLLADPMSALLIALGIGAVLFAVIPMASKGRTIGKALVGVRIVKADGSNAPAWSYWVRYLASALFLLVPLALVLLAPEEIEGASSDILLQIVGLVVIVWLLTIVARVIGSFSGYPYVSLSEIVSSTRLTPATQNTAPTASTTAEENQHTTILGNRENAQARQQEVPQRCQKPSATEDDHGKQAALDSLLAVNYDEQHPVNAASADHAPTQIISSTEAPTQQIAGTKPDAHNEALEGLPTRQIRTPHNTPTHVIQGQHAQAEQTLQLNGASMHADKTELISDPESQRKIRRDQRPDAGGTQVFKKQ